MTEVTSSAVLIRGKPLERFEVLGEPSPAAKAGCNESRYFYLLEMDLQSSSR